MRINLQLLQLENFKSDSEFGTKSQKQNLGRLFFFFFFFATMLLGSGSLTVERKTFS